ncbi:predicted protein [Plenodomus lingam JN3]|uniref:Predicted protein n=1 Tax=Leptosphaeria maculans (strain JN3 / isolate v23.1.3 / race Av1-4-5-6-7-8) TaxID=985895 RepID=E4ZND0_LEPMJ|nr:predicted protein [Plenodomus lingam JN3]CBX92989.1 predicted protein [Plenodomus lingam JN3]
MIALSGVRNIDTPPPNLLRHLNQPEPTNHNRHETTSKGDGNKSHLASRLAYLCIQTSHKRTVSCAIRNYRPVTLLDFSQTRRFDHAPDKMSPPYWTGSPCSDQSRPAAATVLISLQ